MNVKIGMNMLLWGGQIDTQHIPVFASLSEAGYDGVEIPVSGQASAELEKMAAACEELGLERTASAFVGLECNPISSDPAVRAAALDNLKQSIDGANLIGAEILIGGIYQAHKYFTGAAATEAEWQWSVEYLRAGGEYARDKGVRLGLETLNRFEVFLINTSADCKRMVEQVGLENVGVHYDTHHANIEDPSPVEALRDISGVINHVHLSESHRGTLGTGQVDWDETFASLRDINYEGWLVIEAFGTSDPGLAMAANVWRNAFTSREEVYSDGIRFIRDRLKN
ncbi:MAG: sugar phosphate isomerase/epimerase family protein [Halieaceae bacterium]